MTTELISRIFALAHQVTDTTEHEVIAHYAGHVRWITVSVYEGGYVMGEDADFTAAYNLTVDDLTDAIKKLEEYL